MRLLLDAHTLIWAVDDSNKLSPAAMILLHSSGGDLLLSAATVWEIAIKVGLKKLILTLPLRDWMHRATTDLGLTILPITVDYAAIQAVLPWHHRDPFDRFLVAQALTENIPIISCDTVFDQYGVIREW